MRDEGRFREFSCLNWNDEAVQPNLFHNHIKMIFPSRDIASLVFQ